MPEIQFGEINWLAVIVAAVASFLIGAVIYGMVFRKTWIALHKYSEADIAAAGKSQGVELGIIFFCDLLTSLMVAVFVSMTGVAGVGGGLAIGGLVWLGFVATALLVHNAAHRKPPAAYALDAAYHLASLLAIGAIIGAWR